MTTYNIVDTETGEVAGSVQDRVMATLIAATMNNKTNSVRFAVEVAA